MLALKFCSEREKDSMAKKEMGEICLEYHSNIFLEIHIYIGSEKSGGEKNLGTSGTLIPLRQPGIDRTLE